MTSKRVQRSSFFINAVLVLLVINVVIVDVYIISRALRSPDVLGESTDAACPQACIAKINQLSGSISATGAKEYYIPLGSGLGYAREWDDVSGVSAYINTASYGRIKSVTLEVTTRIPAGGQRVWVRLFNATDMHPVWFSELTTDDSQQTLLTSGPISLDTGNKWYKVQMKTQLGVVTNVTSARVKIVTY